jgi:hypothetical protein
VQILLYIKNTKNGMMLAVKANKGPEVIMEIYRGGTNQLREYKNGLIYSKLNG